MTGMNHETIRRGSSYCLRGWFMYLCVKGLGVYLVAKTKSIAALVNDAAAILQRIVRIKAADDNGYASCVTCGVTRHWKELQGGHFISRVFTAHKLCVENIHPQCPGCNGPRRGNLTAYTLYMIDMYGRDFVDELEATKGATRKYSRPEILDVIAELKAQEKELC